MTNAAHTPGHWHLDDPEMDGEILVVDEQEVSVATVWKNPLDPNEWAKANARLIAAAPDLLQAAERALQALQDNYDKYDNCQWHDADSRDAYIALRDAVSMAKGGSI